VRDRPGRGRYASRKAKKRDKKEKGRRERERDVWKIDVEISQQTKIKRTPARETQSPENKGRRHATENRRKRMHTRFKQKSGLKKTGDNGIPGEYYREDIASPRENTTKKDTRRSDDMLLEYNAVLSENTVEEAQKKGNVSERTSKF